MTETKPTKPDHTVRNVVIAFAIIEAIGLLWALWPRR
jgi:hypothetical protein